MILEPTVTDLLVELERCTPDPVGLIEICARKAHDSKVGVRETRSAFVLRVMGMGHLSVIEHPCATFLIEGISRACAQQLTRHRLASYTMRSQRYVDEGEGSFIVPPSITESQLPAFVDDVRRAFGRYSDLVASGVRKEDARFLLPNACATEIALTMNFRQLRHFFSLRCDAHAQWEIRAMACSMLDLIAPVGAPVFDDLYRQYILGEK